MPDKQPEDSLALPPVLQGIVGKVIEAKEGDVIWPPADAEALAGLQGYLRTSFEVDLPGSYRGLLALTDGLEYNSYVIFGASPHREPYLPGLQEFNETLSEVAGSHVFFGETADEMFALFVPGMTWKAVDKASLSTLEEFPDFDAMLMHILQQAIL